MTVCCDGIPIEPPYGILHHWVAVVIGPTIGLRLAGETDRS